MSADPLLAFGPFEVDRSRRRLLRDGEPVAVPAKAFDVLVALIEHRGRVVEKDELLRLVWPGVVVEESNLSQHVFTLRKLLGDTSSAPAYLATIPRRGYQFVGEVVERARAVSARPGPAHRAAERPLSLAILPFAALTSEPGDDYVGYAMADTLSTRLARVPGATVRRASAVRRYLHAPPDVAEAGRDLAVDAVLHGAAQRSGAWIRVTAQLVTVRDREAIWSDHLEAPMDQLVTIEDAIVGRVAALVAADPGVVDALPPRDIVDADAHLAWLRGRFHLARQTSSDVSLAIEHLERAIAREPRAAVAHASLASASALAALLVFDQPAREHAALSRARTAADTALRLDAALPEAHAALAEVAFRSDWHWRHAEQHFTRALQLDPDASLARCGFAQFLAAMGRRAESEDHTRRAQAGGPLPDAPRLSPSRPLSVADARHACEATARRPYALAALGFALGRDGRAAEAREILIELTERYERQASAAWLVAYPLIGVGDHDQAFAWLQRGAAQRGALPAFVDAETVLNDLRADTRFAALRSDILFVRPLAENRRQAGA